MKSVLGLKPSPVRWLPQRAPSVLRGDAPAGSVRAWERIPDGLVVFETLETHEGGEWLHVSASRDGGYPGMLPTWEDMHEVKRVFCGVDAEAYMVLPPEDHYVNDHPFVLHLWIPVDGPLLPDFRRMGPFGKKELVGSPPDHG